MPATSRSSHDADAAVTGTDPGSAAADLERRAARRRQDGTYPDGVDDRLRADFDARLSEAAVQTSALRAAIDDLRAVGPVRLRPYQGTSRLKALYTRAVHAVIGPVLADLVRQVDAHQSALDRVVSVVSAELEGDREGRTRPSDAG